METQFRNMDRAIESQPMPPQFEDTKALVYLQRLLRQKLSQVPLAWPQVWSVSFCVLIMQWVLISQCSCSSYNTAQLQILSGPEPESLPAPDNEGILRGVDVGELVVPSLSENRPSISSTRRNSMSITSPTIENPTSAPNSQPHPSATSIEENPSSTQIVADVDAEDDEEEEDEVDFWGGESPRERRISALQREDTMDEDEDDESMSDENTDGDEEDDADDLEDDKNGYLWASMIIGISCNDITKLVF